MAGLSSFTQAWNVTLLMQIQLNKELSYMYTVL